MEAEISIPDTVLAWGTWKTFSPVAYGRYTVQPKLCNEQGNILHQPLECISNSKQNKIIHFFFGKEGALWLNSQASDSFLLQGCTLNMESYKEEETIVIVKNSIFNIQWLDFLDN